jgi:hypothetical protein
MHASCAVLVGSVVDRPIYFPRGWEPGMKEQYPVVFVVAYRGDQVAASRHCSEAQAGRKSLYPLSRCEPFTAARWLECQRHIEQRQALLREYEQFVKQARTRFIKGNHHAVTRS